MATSALSLYKLPPSAEALLARAERAIESALARGAGQGCPPRLAEALRHAVVPGGHRLRPQMVLLAAMACGDGTPDVTDGAAAAVELLHCASLVHDDMPCFDDAPTRRGRPSVHRAFGEPIALLTGDALIVLAFEVLARTSAQSPARMALLLAELATSAGPTRGIIAGQAWESEPAAPLDEYHRAKTASLFAAAAAMGAIAAGAPPAPWRRFGEAIGRAYQVADDVSDVVGRADALGKPTGRDAALGRPTMVRELGVDGARARAAAHIQAAMLAIPPCEHHAHVRAWVERLATGLV